MKKIFLAISTLLSFSLVTMAQVPGGVDIDLGPKIGVNVTQLSASGQGTSQGNNTLGYFGGLFAMLKIKKFGVQAETFISYDKPDFKIKYDTFSVLSGSTAQQVKAEVEMLNLHIPVLAKYYLIDNEVFGLSVFAGPQYSMLLSQATKVNGQDLKDKNGAKEKVLRDSNVSAVLGIGADLPLGFRADIRYNFGLTDIGNLKDITNRMNIFQISVGKSLF